MKYLWNGKLKGIEISNVYITWVMKMLNYCQSLRKEDSEITYNNAEAIKPEKKSEYFWYF